MGGICTNREVSLCKKACYTQCLTSVLGHYTCVIHNELHITYV